MRMIRTQCWACRAKMTKPVWVMGAIFNTAWQCIKRIRHKQMLPDEVTWAGWGDIANYFRESDTKYGTTKLIVLPVVIPQPDDVVAAASHPTFRELMESPDIIPGSSQWTQGTSRQGSCHIRPGSGKPQSNKRIHSLPPCLVRNSSLITHAMSVGPISFYPCILPPQQITIQKSESDEEMETAQAVPEEYSCILWLSTSYLCEIISCIYFSMCQLSLDFSDQILGHNNSSLHVQGLYVWCDSSRLQIWL